MSKVRRIDFYPDDFLVGTSGMNPTEGWVYWIACVLMYSRGGPIQIDDLRRWLRLRGVHFQQAFDALVEAGKLTLDGSSIRSQRVLNELSRASQRVLKLSSNGSQGGRPPRDANGLAKPDGFLAREQSATNNQHASPDGDASPPESVPPREEHHHVRRQGTRLPLDWQPDLDDC